MLKALRYGSYVLHKRNRPPFYLIHFVTERCTANCRHCFLDREHTERTGRELTIDEIETIARKLKRLLFVFLTGGEPFLRDDLPEIAQAYHRYAGVQKIQCPTNGSRPDEAVRFARIVAGSCPDLHVSVTVSFDAVGEKHDASRRTPGLFEHTVETFKRLKEEEKKWPNFNVNATTTVSAFNQYDLDDLYRFVRETLGCQNYFNTLVRGMPRDPSTREVDIDLFEQFNDRLERGLIEEGMRGYQRFAFAEFVNAKNLISRRMIAEVARSGAYQTPCFAGQIAGVMYSRGEIYPCELLDHPFGNIRDFDYDLQTLWRSAEAEDIRRFIKNSRCVCTHECFTTLNILFNCRFLPRLIGSSIRLKLGRKRRYRVSP